jgi:hypothetical protein
MSTTETNDGPTTDGGRFCEHCGSALPGGRYCPGCGRPVNPVGHRPDADNAAQPPDAAALDADAEAADAADDEPTTTAQPAITPSAVGAVDLAVDGTTAAPPPSPTAPLGSDH